MVDHLQLDLKGGWILFSWFHRHLKDSDCLGPKFSTQGECGHEVLRAAN